LESRRREDTRYSRSAQIGERVKPRQFGIDYAGMAHDHAAVPACRRENPETAWRNRPGANASVPAMPVVRKPSRRRGGGSAG